VTVTQPDGTTASMRDLRDKTVLIAGGTKGIGLATGLRFGRAGAACVLTYHWGSADETTVRAAFERAGAVDPILINADMSRQEDTEDLMRQLREQCEVVDTFVSNVAVAPRVGRLEDINSRDFHRTFDYSVIPVIEYLQAIRRTFGRPPKYMIALSSTGIDHFTPNYAMVAASKAALEALCRYVSYDLRDEDFRFNVVRTLGVITDSFRDMFGAEFEEAVRRHIPEEWLVQASEVADVILALCSGYFDALKGQAITVDKGALFADTVMRLYEEQSDLGL